MAKRQKQEIDLAAFTADVRADMSTNQLAQKYCNGAWAAAKKLRDEVEFVDRAASSEKAEPTTQAGASAAEQVSEETHWSLPLNIRKDRLVAALEGMDHEEIAAAVIKCGDGDVQTIVLTAVMQRRLDAELADN